jgi:hypothetical protein
MDPPLVTRLLQSLFYLIHSETLFSIQGLGFGYWSTARHATARVRAAHRLRFWAVSHKRKVCSIGSSIRCRHLAARRKQRGHVFIFVLRFGGPLIDVHNVVLWGVWYGGSLAKAKLHRPVPNTARDHMITGFDEYKTNSRCLHEERATLTEHFFCFCFCDDRDR